jgi:hypothetical protein
VISQSSNKSEFELAQKNQEINITFNKLVLLADTDSITNTNIMISQINNKLEYNTIKISKNYLF